MADSDLKINVVTTADLTGLKDVQSQVSTMNADIQKQLAAAGATFDPITNSFKSVVQSARATTQEVIKTGEAFKITRQEAAALASELIRGAASARSIGTSFAAFGSTVAIGALAVFTVFEKLIQAVNQLNKEQDQWTDGVLKTEQEVRKLQEAFQETEDTLRETALIKAFPLQEGLERAQQDLIRLKEEQSLINRGTEDGEKEYENYNKRIVDATRLVDELVKKQEHQGDVIFQTQDQIARNLATGNEELSIQTQVNQAYDQRLKLLREAQVPEEDAVRLATEFRESERQRLETIRGQAPAQRDYNAALHDAQDVLQSIRQQQQLISSAPFMGSDAKQTALLASYRQELQAVAVAMANLQRQKTADALDPAKLEADNREMQKLVVNAQQLGQKIDAAVRPLQAELQNWANSFGSTMHQLASTIEQTVGASLQSLNTYLVTGKFNAQALLQQIETLGLQLIEQMIIQRVMAAVNASAATGQAAVTGPAIAAAFAPAATTVTIATEGAAALAAPGEYAVALAAIQGMALAHEGGPIRFHSGGLAPDEVPIIAQSGEFMIQRSVASQPGMMDYLSALNEGMYHGGGWIRRMHRGGRGGDDSNIHPGDINDLFDLPTRFGFNPSGAPYGGNNQPINPVVYPDLTPPDFPDITDPNVTGGPSRRQLIESMYPDLADEYTPHELNSMTEMMINMGYLPQFGTPGFGQGPTMIPTTFNPEGYPMAVSVSTGDVNVNPGGSYHSGTLHKPQHRGGPIRLHSGGSTGGGGRAGGSAFGAPQVHVYAFTDLKALTRHMGSREGQKVIFDTVQGRRIDLGIK